MKKIFENEILGGLITIIVVTTIVATIVTVKNFDFKNYLKSLHPQKGDFVKVGKMSVPRWGHETVLLDDGTVLIYGGTETATTPELYNPKTKKFTRVGKMLIRGHEIPINLHNGKILIIGGIAKRAPKGTQFYNTLTKKFEIGPDLNYSREYVAVTRLMDGRLLITGGEDVDLKGEKLPLAWPVSRCEIYNPKTNKFEIGAEMNIPRLKHSAVLLQDGRVLIVGGSGYNTRNFYKLSSAEIYDPKTNKFQLAGNMNSPKVMPNLYLLKNGNVLITNVFGREMEIYNPKTNEFKIIAKRTSEPEMPAEVLLKDDTILFTGGQTGVGLSLWWYKTSEIFDPKTGKFTKGKDMNFLRSGHRMTLLKDGNVLISGSDGKGRTAELYISK